MRLLILPVPVDVLLIVLDAIPIPATVFIVDPPTMLQFLMVLLVAGLVVSTVCSHTTAELVPVPVFVIVKSLEAVVSGQMELLVLEILPLIVTQSAPFNTMIAPVELPVIAVFANEGLMVKVFVALASVLLLMVIGKVSPVV